MPSAPPRKAALPPLAPPANLVDPAQRRAFEVLSSICPPAVVEKSPGKPQVGCACCPPFDDCAASAGRTVSTDADRFYAANSVVYGAFTAAGRDEVAISMDGCESHADNYGGLLLVERDAPGWRLVRYDTGKHPDAMKAYRLAGGRDLLVCAWRNSHQTTSHLLYALDLAARSDHLDPFVEVVDNAFFSCAGIRPGEAAHADRIDAFDVVDGDGDGVPDVRVRIHRASTSATPAFTAKCQEMFNATEGSPPVDLESTMDQRDEVSWWSFDGTQFVAMP